MSPYLLEIKEDESLDSCVIPSMNFDTDEFDLLEFIGQRTKAILKCYRVKSKHLFYLEATKKAIAEGEENA